MAITFPTTCPHCAADLTKTMASRLQMCVPVELLADGSPVIHLNLRALSLKADVQPVLICKACGKKVLSTTSITKK